MYKVIEVGRDIEGKGKVYLKKEIEFETKQDAWDWFMQSMHEHYVKDFWVYIGWNDKEVVSTHMDEGGDYVCSLQKWDNFDDDIKFGWEYNGVVYGSIKELAEAFPCYFSEKDTIEDKPLIWGKDNQIAVLSIEVRNGIDDDKETYEL